jgi:cytochrome c
MISRGNGNRMTYGRLATISVGVTAAVVIALTGVRAAGTFTSNQADQGRQVYFQQCATCHGEQLEGKVGPALSGRQFYQMIAAQNLNAASLFQFISEHMPLTKPGSLSQEKYVDIFAYILQQNGLAPGPQPLTAEPSELQKIPLKSGANG